MPLSVSLLNTDNSAYLLLTGVANEKTIGTIFKYSNNTFEKISAFLISSTASEALSSFSQDDYFAIIDPLSKKLSIIKYLSEGSFSTEPYVSPLAFSSNVYTTGDFNSDGHKDIAIVDNSDTNSSVHFLISGNTPGNISFSPSQDSIKLS